MSGFEILEHTADVGIRAWGHDVEECFKQATHALAQIMGADVPGDGVAVAVEAEASDIGGVLVAWLDEVLYVLEVRDALLGSVDVTAVDDTHARGTLFLTDRADRDEEGVQVKAVTFHRLSVRRRDEGGYVAEVYVDV